MSGQCALNTIDGTNAPTTFTNTDAAPDTCGDINDAHNPQLMEFYLVRTEVNP